MPNKHLSIETEIVNHIILSLQVFVKRLKKAVAYKDPQAAARLKKNKPIYKLDGIVKERYVNLKLLLRKTIWNFVAFRH